MPRLPPSLIRRAHHISPYLAALLPACRDLGSARNELRWLREHVSELLSQSRLRSSSSSSNHGSLNALHLQGNSSLLSRLCRQRGRGTPLQYVLGSQPFGDLEIRCRRGVLIPRPETEAWAAHLAGVVRAGVALGGDGERGVENDNSEGLGILDLCTGSGCIALLLDSLLRRRFPGMVTRGYDVNPRAVGLARENLARNVGRHELGWNPGHKVCFEHADIFAVDFLPSVAEEMGTVDVLVSNPPYISARGFSHDTARSVRNFEPKLALVPSPVMFSSSSTKDGRPEDVFYARLLDIAKELSPRFMVFEVGDLAQGLRVARMASEWCSDSVAHDVEVWRDWPDMRPGEDEAEVVDIDGVDVPVRGSGNGRAVFIRRVV